MKNKKNFKKIEKQINNENNEVKKIIKIFVGVVIFLIIAYLLMGIITGEIDLGKNKETVAEIQYKEILAEMTLKQNDEEYFVIYYNFDEEDSLISAIINVLASNQKVYEVDLSKKFNYNYIGDVKTDVKSIEDLKVKNPTLIKVANKKIEKVVFGIDSIKKYVSTIK